MVKIAVDIVLLPPKDIADAAIAYNKELQEKEPQKIILGNDDGIPHISLAMGMLDESDLDDAKLLLENIATTADSLYLDIEALYTTALTGSVALQITKSEELQKLHEVVTERFKPLLTHDADASMFVSPPEIGDSAPATVREYITKGSYEHYHPHITLGHGELAFKSPLHFKAGWIALCRLGVKCTCRKMIAHYNLQ